MIRFFNTLSGKNEEFKPLHDKEVRLYTCGPTVYDYAHIGNFRAFVFEDLLRRFLEFSGYKVTHVMNFTDVDDKTIAGAAREGKKLDDFTGQYIKAFNEDLKTLNCLEPNKQPRATQEIKGMQELIQKLIQNGAAYGNEGSVYYSISKFPGYGKLSKKKLDMNIAGASKRIDVDEYDKEQVSDFVLWKKAKEGEPSWDSPWGRGRPGWHIECSAMSMKYLGETFDIHAGGEDLIFPHHENEIAQSEAATGKPFVKYWLHCKFLIVDGKKMSKKDKNFYTLRDLLAKGYDPMAIRYALLVTHYRTPLNFTLDGLKESGEVVERLRRTYNDLLHFSRFGVDAKTSHESKNYDLISHIRDEVTWMIKALENDLNISLAFSHVFNGIKGINFVIANKLMNEANLKQSLLFFDTVEHLFGLNIIKQSEIPSEVLELHEQRSAIRRSPKFKQDKNLQKLSDDLRKKIDELGWNVKDGRPGEPSILQPK